MTTARNSLLRHSVAGGLALALTVACTSMVSAAPTQQSICPLGSDELVSSVVGQPVSASELLVSRSGPRDECIFESAEGIILIGRVGGFFGSAGSEAMAPNNLQSLTRTSIELVYTPEPGVGEAATWAEAADPAIREERLSVLIVRRGADAYFLGVDQSAFPASRSLTIALATAVLAANP